MDLLFFSVSSLSSLLPDCDWYPHWLLGSCMLLRCSSCKSAWPSCNQFDSDVCLAALSNYIVYALVARTKYLSRSAGFARRIPEDFFRDCLNTQSIQCNFFSVSRFPNNCVPVSHCDQVVLLIDIAHHFADFFIHAFHFLIRMLICGHIHLYYYMSRSSALESGDHFSEQ